MPTTSELSQMMVEGFLPEKADGVNAIIQFDLSGDNGGQFFLDIKEGAIEAHDGATDNPNMTLKAAADDYFAVASGEMNPMQAFMSGKIKIQGDMSLAMKLQSMFKQN